MSSLVPFSIDTRSSRRRAANRGIDPRQTSFNPTTHCIVSQAESDHIPGSLTARLSTVTKPTSSRATPKSVHTPHKTTENQPHNQSTTPAKEQPTHTLIKTQTDFNTPTHEHKPQPVIDNPSWAPQHKETKPSATPPNKHTSTNQTKSTFKLSPAETAALAQFTPPSFSAAMIASAAKLESKSLGVRDADADIDIDIDVGDVRERARVQALLLSPALGVNDAEDGPFGEFSCGKMSEAGVCDDGDVDAQAQTVGPVSDAFLASLVGDGYGGFS